MAEPDAYSSDLGDWRLMSAFWATGTDGALWDAPRAGRRSTWYSPKAGSEFSFPTPSAAALHLNAAWKAAKRAHVAKQALAIHVFVGDGGNYSMQSAESSTAALFDYFEEMIAVAFGSFGAIEAFCNQTLIEQAKGPITVTRRKGEQALSPEEVEREVSTDEKVKRVLPSLLGIPTPAGKATWDVYLDIKRIRDAVTHFKRRDQMRHAAKAHEPTALLDLYGLDCFKLPEDAMKVLRYFQPVAPPRWMVNPTWERLPAENLPPMPNKEPARS